MKKFDYRKWVTENKYGKLNEQGFLPCYGCQNGQVVLVPGAGAGQPGTCGSNNTYGAMNTNQNWSGFSNCTGSAPPPPPPPPPSTGSGTGSSDPNCYACSNGNISSLPLSQIQNSSGVIGSNGSCGSSPQTGNWIQYYSSVSTLNSVLMTASGSGCGSSPTGSSGGGCISSSIAQNMNNNANPTPASTIIYNAPASTQWKANAVNTFAGYSCGQVQNRYNHFDGQVNSGQFSGNNLARKTAKRDALQIISNTCCSNTKESRLQENNYFKYRNKLNVKKSQIEENDLRRLIKKLLIKEQKSKRKIYKNQRYLNEQSTPTPPVNCSPTNGTCHTFVKCINGVAEPITAAFTLWEFQYGITPDQAYTDLGGPAQGDAIQLTTGDVLVYTGIMNGLPLLNISSQYGITPSGPMPNGPFSHAGIASPSLCTPPDYGWTCHKKRTPQDIGMSIPEGRLNEWAPYSICIRGTFLNPGAFATKADCIDSGCQGISNKDREKYIDIDFGGNKKTDYEDYPGETEG